MPSRVWLALNDSAVELSMSQMDHIEKAVREAIKREQCDEWGHSWVLVTVGSRDLPVSAYCAICGLQAEAPTGGDDNDG